MTSTDRPPVPSVKPCRRRSWPAETLGDFARRSVHRRRSAVEGADPAVFLSRSGSVANSEADRVEARRLAGPPRAASIGRGNLRISVDVSESVRQTINPRRAMWCDVNRSLAPPRPTHVGQVVGHRVPITPRRSRRHGHAAQVWRPVGGMKAECIHAAPRPSVPATGETSPDKSTSVSATNVLHDWWGFRRCAGEAWWRRRRCDPLSAVESCWSGNPRLPISTTCWLRCCMVS